MRTDPKRAKNTVKLLVCLTLLGSVQVKAAQRTLKKLTYDLLVEMNHRLKDDPEEILGVKII
jgi:hypothetical protein